MSSEGRFHCVCYAATSQAITDPSHIPRLMRPPFRQVLFEAHDRVCPSCKIRVFGHSRQLSELVNEKRQWEEKLGNRIGERAREGLGVMSQQAPQAEFKGKSVTAHSSTVLDLLTPPVPQDILGQLAFAHVQQQILAHHTL